MKNYSLNDTAAVLADLQYKAKTLLDWRRYYFPTASQLEKYQGTTPWKDLSFRQSLIVTGTELEFNNTTLPIGTQIINSFRPSTNGADSPSNPSREDYNHYLIIEPPVGVIFAQGFRQNSNNSIDFIWSAVSDDNNKFTTSYTNFYLLDGKLPRYCNKLNNLKLTDEDGNQKIIDGNILIESSEKLKILFNPTSGDYWPPVVPQIIERYSNGTQEEFVTDMIINFNNQKITSSSLNRLASGITATTPFPGSGFLSNETNALVVNII